MALSMSVLKILTLFLFPFSNKMLVIRVGTHKILVTFINKEDPDQNASSEAVLSESALIDVCVILDTTWAST